MYSTQGMEKTSKQMLITLWIEKYLFHIHASKYSFTFGVIIKLALWIQKKASCLRISVSLVLYEYIQSGQGGVLTQICFSLATAPLGFQLKLLRSHHCSRAKLPLLPELCYNEFLPECSWDQDASSSDGKLDFPKHPDQQRFPLQLYHYH